MMNYELEWIRKEEVMANRGTIKALQGLNVFLCYKQT
jgi:hypothetical protein